MWWQCIRCFVSFFSIIQYTPHIYKYIYTSRRHHTVQSFVQSCWCVCHFLIFYFSIIPPSSTWYPPGISYIYLCIGTLSSEFQYHSYTNCIIYLCTRNKRVRYILMKWPQIVARTSCNVLCTSTLLNASSKSVLFSFLFFYCDVPIILLHLII